MAFAGFVPKGRTRQRHFAAKLDRGRIRGARWCFVTPARDMVPYAQRWSGAKKPNEWILFRSTKEAKRWLALLALQDAGEIVRLRRQVPFWLHAHVMSWEGRVANDGLAFMTVGKYIADHVYDRGGSVVVEDVKPSGGHREDLYLWKRKHFEAEYGLPITEF